MSESGEGRDRGGLPVSPSETLIPTSEVTGFVGVVALDVDANGKLRKMSKSYHNAIYLSDSADEVATKLKTAYTSPMTSR